MAPVQRPSTARTLRAYALGFLIWTGWVVLCFFQEHASLALKGVKIPTGYMLQRCAEDWYTWAVLSLGVFWLAGRLPLEPGRLRTRIPIHLLGSLLTAILFCSISAAILDGRKSVMEDMVFTWKSAFLRMAQNSLSIYMVFYWVFLLGHHSWHYFRKSREREQQAAALTHELVNARLEALRMQLNPHFLFNTLNTISALVHTDPKAADRMVVRLSELLRRTLDQSDVQEVPLGQELSFLRGYLEIEQARFADRLSVAMEIEAGTEELFVPSLILQPLVENSIRHGIEPREEAGRVEIRARRLGDRLELVVRDNGNGLTEAQGAAPREGVGLTNTRSRLAHLYGGDHEFELSKVPGGGLQVRLLLPCRQASQATDPERAGMPDRRIYNARRGVEAPAAASLRG